MDNTYQFSMHQREMQSFELHRASVTINQCICDVQKFWMFVFSCLHCNQSGSQPLPSKILSWALEHFELWSITKGRWYGVKCRNLMKTTCWTISQTLKPYKIWSRKVATDLTVASVQKHQVSVTVNQFHAIRDTPSLVFLTRLQQ